MPAETISILPQADQRYVEEHTIAVEPLCDGNQKAIVLEKFDLPQDRYQVATADILILLPPTYPDSPPDMFYADPWLQLIPTGQYPKAADQAHEFGGRRWQRWSRHNNQWRPGVDGLRTFIRRIATALEEAQ